MPDVNQIAGLMREAINEAKKSATEDEGVHPMVGAVIADQDGKILHRAHRGEEPGCHAEFLCLRKAESAGQNLTDCLLFVTLEPCTARGPGKTACASRIIDSGIRKVYIGMLDPNPAICGRGETRLRFSVDVERFPLELVREIEKMNEDFIALHKKAHLSEESLYVRMQIQQIMRSHLERAGLPLEDDLPVGVDLTTSDISTICQACGAAAGKTADEIYTLVHRARAEAFDKKYADRTYDDDGRGLGDYWKNSVRSILGQMDAADLTNKRIVVVGIGNGLEGEALYGSCEEVVAVDIGKRSLERAKKAFPAATLLEASAENLEKIPNGSQDIYISLRTYQSTYFDRSAALREAYRVVRQGGIVLISVANGFLESGSMIPGLVIPGTSVVDRDLGFDIASQIRSRMSLMKFEEIGLGTSLDEIYVYGRRGR